MVAVCSPDLDLFSPETGTSATPLVSPAEAVEFLPWLKAALPVASVLDFESKIAALTQQDESGGASLPEVEASVIDAFVRVVSSIRLLGLGTLPFDRMDGCVDRVRLGLAEETRLRAAMRALLSGVVVSCECPAYPARWRKRLRRGGLKVATPSLFDFDFGFDFEVEPRMTSEDGDVVPTGLMVTRFGDVGSEPSMVSAPYAFSGGEPRGWGLFNGPACLWVWPPIDPLVLNSGENRLHEGDGAERIDLIDSRCVGLGNDRQTIVGGVGSRKPMSVEAELAARVGRVLFGNVPGKRDLEPLGVDREGTNVEIRIEICAPSGIGLAHDGVGLAQGGAGLAQGGVGLVSGGARGIDTAFMGGSGRSGSHVNPLNEPYPDRAVRRWVILPEGLGSAGLLGSGGVLGSSGLKRSGDVAGGYELAALVGSLRARRSEPLSFGGVRWMSPFGWRAGFSGTRAMLRNRLIYAFADETIVFSCRLGVGGTWGGAVSALREGRRVRIPVILDQREKAHPEPDAFRALVRLGAIPLKIHVRREQLVCGAESPERTRDIPERSPLSTNSLVEVGNEETPIEEGFRQAAS